LFQFGIDLVEKPTLGSKGEAGTLGTVEFSQMLKGPFVLGLQMQTILHMVVQRRIQSRRHIAGGAGADSVQ
jgi:hypothetical protein